jgi:hypothetical protein
MITPAEENYIKSHAYLPEHIPDYVTAISDVETYLFSDYLYYCGKEQLIFIGYPLKAPGVGRNMEDILHHAIEKARPKYVALAAPAISIPDLIRGRDVCYRSASDYYYKLDLPHFCVNKKIRNMIRRASRELNIEKSQEIEDGHLMLISEFLNSHEVDDTTRYIFERVPKYLSSSPTAWVFSARDKAKRLVAFDVAEFAAKDYAFYMFNFRLRQHSVPGASDSLLHEVIKAAKKQGKSFLNLGLGINEGVRFFKKKWGGHPFLSYEFCLYQRGHIDRLKSLFEKL